MVNHIANNFKKNIKLFIYLTLYLSFFSILFFFFGHNTFQISNDNLYQYEIFYEEWIKIVINFLKTGKLNTYSFNMFLGTDFYSSMGYYCIGDIFLPILLLFSNNVPMGLLIETVLLIYISAILMNCFLQKKGIKNNNVIIFISILYAVGGQAILYTQNYMFHRFFSFLPLLFLGIEKYLQNKNKKTLIIATFILFTQNYYFMYMTLVFLFFYSLVECLSRNMSSKEIISCFFDCLFSLIIGFLMSAIITLPSMIGILGNVASRQSTNNVPFWELNSIFGIVSSILYLNPYGAAPDLFNIPYDFNGSWYNLFITIIPFGFILLNINDKENRKRNIFLLILFIVAFIKPLNSIMHGFSTPSLRWLFLLEFYLLYLSALYMDKEYNKKKLFYILIGIIISNIILLIILYLLNYVKSDMEWHLSYTIISLLINIIIVILFKYFNKLSYILSILFICFSTLIYYDGLSSYLYVPLISKSEIDYYQDFESTYYRYYNSYMNSYSCSPLDSNSSLLYDIMTTSTYSSTYDTTINRFLGLTNNTISLDWNVEISDPEALTMLGTKYYIIGDRIKDQYELDPSLEYKYSLKSINQYDIYYNKNYRGFGYCAENIDYTSNYKSDINKNFVNTIFVDDDSIDISTYKNISYSQLDVKYMGDNYVYAEIMNNEDNILLIPLPNNKGWSIMVNGSQVTPISVNGGFIGLQLNNGFNEIEMRFSTPYLKIGACMSFVGLLLFVFVIMKENKRV